MTRIPGWVWLLIVTGLAILVRSRGLAWQPLWWDEGYSVFFATESLADMMALTARDIHPPLYYGLLHLWVAGWGNAHPVTLRAFSVLIGGLTIPAMWWTTRTLSPGRSRMAWVATLLLAVNPMHLFYSQEVRMYGLELLLGLLSTGWFLRLWTVRTPGQRRRAVLIYAVITAAALYTEYYVALLPFAHFLWAVAWRWRKPRTLLPVLAAQSLAALLFLPWLIFAVPHLFDYIQAKVVADNDAPLSLLSYLTRHLSAFGGGHIPLPRLDWLRYAGAAGILVAGVLGLWGRFVSDGWRGRRASAEPFSFLVVGGILPVGMGYILNRLWPFFPDGGERVLFFLLPGLLMLVAGALVQVDLGKMRRGTGLAGASVILAAMLLLTGAGAGVTAFYTVPRYGDDDYRPLIRQVTQQGTDADTVVAVFPWQVGFWRAYGPVYTPGGDPSLGLAPGVDDVHGPWPRLLSFDPVAWGPDVAAQLDAAVADGVVWLPSLLSIGSTLPQEMEAHLAQTAVNVENRWLSPTTRLSAWTRPQPVDLTDTDLGNVIADFGPVILAQAGVAPTRVASANQPIQVNLRWADTGSDPGADPIPLQAILRLRDEAGRTWAERGYTPTEADLISAVAIPVGLIVPAGLPDGDYTVVVGVGPMPQDILGSEVDLLPVAGRNDPWVTVGHVAVVQSQRPLPALRLPIQHALDAPAPHGPLALLGYSGPSVDQPVLAGTDVPLTLFWWGRAEDVAAAWVPQAFFVSLLGKNGDVAGWTGTGAWLGGSPSWIAGGLAQAPASVQIPGYVDSGRYDVAAGLVLADGSRTAPTVLGQVSVQRRAATFAPVSPEHALDPPMQFGTHALLLGYDLHIQPGTLGDLLALTLYWQVEQPLWPAHQLFVHVEEGGASGERLAQSDTVPNHDGQPAPTGSWQPGEILIHRQSLRLPPDVDLGTGGIVARVGLYIPETGVRLPVSQDGVVLGDSVAIPLPWPTLP